ncbi:MAG: C4-dicarboxylate TRAP transporter substrate-binding protein [Gammaproteobacteria bacterium]|nr:C4-dicarboxylate TRAP transporter substrate-binding protein [Gammaproteobacteria bacterium]
MKAVGAAAVAALVLAALLLRPAAEIDPDHIELTVGSSHSTGLPWVGVMHTLVVPESNRRLEARGSPYRIRWTEAYGGSLYKYHHTLEAVEIGLADMGWVGTIWELSKMPLQNLTYYTPFSTSDPQMLFRVMNELNEQVPAFADSWTAQNLRFLGVNASDTYHLMTNFPVRTVDDLRGRKILAPGPAAAWLKGTGAVAVDGGLTTYYTQIQTGVADGVLTILSGALPYRIHEVAPHITLVGIGAQVTGAFSMNLDTWDSLPPDVQQVFAELGPAYSEAVAAEVVERYETSLETMRMEGAIVAELPIEEKRRWLDGLPNIAVEWAEATEARGFPAVEALHAYMRTIRDRGAQPLRDWDEAAVLEAPPGVGGAGAQVTPD